MVDDMTPNEVSIREIAWSWVVRQHEWNTFDAAAQAELVRWLAADPAHKRAYDKAGRVWLMAGLLPPSDDIETPDRAPEE